MMDMGIQTLFGLICGIALAYAYFKVLWLSAQQFSTVRHRQMFLWGVFLYRIGVFVSVGICMVQESKPAFMGMIMAFFITRFIAIRHLQGVPND